MPTLINFTLVLMILCHFTDGIWSSNVHKQGYYGLEAQPSSEEDLKIGFKSSNVQYYNSREAHGVIVDKVDDKIVTEHYYTNSNEYSEEENPGSIATILEGHLNNSGVNNYPYPLRTGSQNAYEISKYAPDTVKINLDISDYLEALSDKKEAINENHEPLNTRKLYGQAPPGVIFAEHRYPVPLSISHILDIDSIESKEDLTGNVNTKYAHAPFTINESKEVHSHETFGPYPSDTEAVRYAELTSAESSETTESWALLPLGQTRIRPGVPQDFPSTEVSLPQCSGSKKDKQQGKCRKEQNLCRSTGDCRIARIWGTCCNSPGCGSYCKPNKSNCPHPNSLKEACVIKSDIVCNPHNDACPRGTFCCQTPCGFRCV